MLRYCGWGFIAGCGSPQANAPIIRRKLLRTVAAWRLSAMASIGPQTVAVISVPFTAWRARALPAVKPAPAVLHCRLSTRRPPATCLRTTSRRCRWVAGAVAVLQPTARCEVVAQFPCPPLRREPLFLTAPATIACPPFATFTCCTVTSCCLPFRSRSSVSKPWPCSEHRAPVVWRAWWPSTSQRRGG